MPEHIPFIRIFVSSPGDVNDERKIALEVIEQLPYRPAFREKVAFRVVAWDKPGAGTRMRARLTPQDAINKGLPTPAECDIVIVLFWSRMGTPFTHTDGKDFLSGTHWELLNALEAKRPEIVIYRRSDEPPFKISDPNFNKLYKQYMTVQTFFNSDLFSELDSKIKRGINYYKSPDEFRRAFETHLEEMVLDILNGGKPTAAPEPYVNDSENISLVRAVKWDPAKSPFPGLRSFTEKDADIFFGRGYEIDALISQLTSSRVVAVVGASGSGKSSLVGAGLTPRLRANAIPGSKDWRIVRFTPGESPFERLYAALLEIFPALKPNPMEARRIKQNFMADMREAPETLLDISATGLVDAPEWADVLLFVDQFEELFTLASKTDALAFVRMLEAISHSERVRIVLTMRADFYHRAVEYPQLAEILRTGSFPLAIPKRDALRQMIERPAERAGLTFDYTLVEQILDDTGDEPGNLALMAYALDELYKLDNDKLLTHEEYQQLGGVQGAIGTRAEAVFAALEADDTMIQQVFHALIEVDERGTATRRRATFQPETLPESVRKLIAAFTNARLLTTSYDELGKTAIVEVAHEAILRNWNRLALWIEDTQDDLRLLRQLRNAAQEWDERNHPPYLLWQQERLQLVYAMNERLNPELNDVESAFIEPEQTRLLRELEKIETSHQRRRDIGDRLAVIGDTRFGVGVKDNVPELSWLPVAVEADPVMIKTNEVAIGPVLIPPFFIAQYLVTYTQFQTFIDANDGFNDDRWWTEIPDQYQKQKMAQQRTKIANAPRDNLSWYQCIAFTRWLNHRFHGKVFEHPNLQTPLIVGENAEMRLPLEWEWQWVAQAGSAANTYPWGEWQEGFANTSEAGLNRTIAVGMYPQGAANCRALDMTGNIFEWCQNDLKNHRILDGFSDGENKVLRGGSFGNVHFSAACSFRYDSAMYLRLDYHGLRLVVGSPIATQISEEAVN